MNAVIPSSLMALKAPYYNQGYVDLINVPMGTGTELLVDSTRTTVVRIGADPAFDHFAQFVQAAPQLYFPCIRKHICPYGPLGPHGAATLTEMECLDPLSPQQQLQAAAWIDTAINAMLKQCSIPVFNQLELAYTNLIDETRRYHANNNPPHPFLGPDLQTKNFMIRPSTGNWVFIDGLG